MVITLLAVGGTAVGVTAQAAAPPLGDCSGIQNDTAVVTDATGERLAGDERLSPGTELSVVVCNGGERLERETLWTLQESSVYERVGNGSESVHLRVVAADNASVSFGEVVRGKEATGPSVTVPTVHTATWNGSDGEYTLRFTSAADADAFRTATADYDAARKRANETLAALPQNASGVAGDESVANVSAAVGELTQASAQLGETAFAATATGDSETALAVADDAAAATTAVRIRARERLRAYQSAVVDRESAIGSTVRLFYAAGAVGGVVLGAVAGGLFAKRRREQIEYDQTYDSESQRSVRDVIVPLVVGVVLLLGGAAAPVVLGFLGVMV